MTRGRKPKPAALLRLAGNRRARAHKNQARLKKPADVPPPPDFLGTIAVEKWKELAPRLLRVNTLTEGDRDQLAAYCQAYGFWVEASQHLEEEDLVITHHNGVKGLNHWVRVAQLAMDRMDRCGAELGLSPTSRARLKIEVPEDDPLLNFLAGDPC